MGKYYEQFINPCPSCNGQITDHSYDRMIVFKCLECNIIKQYPGLLQAKISPVMIPYKDNDGNIIDPKDVKNQEYYHQNANEIAIEEMNKWIYNQNIQSNRADKINQILQ